jgi:hypothetical protein
MQRDAAFRSDVSEQLPSRKVVRNVGLLRWSICSSTISLTVLPGISLMNKNRFLLTHLADTDILHNRVGGRQHQQQQKG